jgi:hypothetical protein
VIRALLAAALVAGCGVKAPPRPPLAPGAAPAAAAAEPARCDGCATAPAPRPEKGP